jgi:hypothetical protein
LRRVRLVLQVLVLQQALPQRVLQVRVHSQVLVLSLVLEPLLQAQQVVRVR